MEGGEGVAGLPTRRDCSYLTVYRSGSSLKVVTLCLRGGIDGISRITYLVRSTRSHLFFETKDGSFSLTRWHLGFCNWRYTPRYRGFDTFLGYYGGQEGYYNHTNGKGEKLNDGDDVSGGGGDDDDDDVDNDDDGDII